MHSQRINQKDKKKLPSSQSKKVKESDAEMKDESEVKNSQSQTRRMSSKTNEKQSQPQTTKQKMAKSQIKESQSGKQEKEKKAMITEKNVKAKQSKEEQKVKKDKIGHKVDSDIDISEDHQESESSDEKEFQKPKNPPRFSQRPLSKESQLSIRSSYIEQGPIIIEKLIQKEQQMDSKSRIKFQGIKNKDSSNQICQICFQVHKYPDEDLSITIENDPDDYEVYYDSLSTKHRDAYLLHELIYCQECSVPVHWGCLGERTKVQQYSKSKEEYKLFKCQKCELKEKERALKMKCIVCDKEEGFLKYYQSSTQSDDQQKGYIFYHPICAMSFPDQFYLIENLTMEFRINTKYEHEFESQSQLKKKQSECQICKSSKGKLLRCSNQEQHHCEKMAHPYCITNGMKDYTFISVTDTDEAEKVCSNRWMYQIFCEKNGNNPRPVITCKDHIKSVKYCFCGIAKDNLVGCDYCQIWFHQSCLPEYDQVEFQNKGFMCFKCKEWNKILNSPILDIILKRSNYDDITNEDKTEWTFESLFFQDERLRNVENKIFEQTLLAKAWFVLAQQLQKKKATQKLIENHLNEGKRLLINDELGRQTLTRKLDKGNQFIAEEIQRAKKNGDLIVKDVIDKEGNVIPEVNDNNNKINKRIQDLSKSCQNNCKLVNNELQEICKIKDQIGILNEIYKLFNEKNQKGLKPNPELLSELIIKMDQFDLNKFVSFELIKSYHSQYEEWAQKIQKKLNLFANNEDLIKRKLENFKNTKYGTELEIKRYKYLHDLLSKKPLIQEAQNIEESGLQLECDADELLKLIQGAVQKVEEIEKMSLKTEKSNNKPVQYIFKNLQTAALLAFSTKNLLLILEKWQECAIWNAKASDFIKDKLLQNKRRGMQIDSDQEMMDETGDRKSYLWSLDEARSLLKEAEDKKLYYDQKIFNYVKDKISICEKLKKQCKPFMANQQPYEVVTSYLREMQEYQNIDFKEEIEICKQKLELIEQVREALDNDNKTKMSIESLEKISQKIEELSNAKSNSIQINLEWDMTLMFKAKLKVAQDLKKEFQEIMNQNQNTFTKQMTADLRRIVTKASKDHNLDMTKEQQIIQCLNFSEEWFMNTYEKVKKIGGRELHQIDFKDFVQLSTVIQEEKDCEILLRYQQKVTPSDQLVGAAYNLWKSLSGVKWLFELRKLIAAVDKQDIEIKRILDLNQKAKDLEINYETEIKKENIYQRFFEELKKLLETINKFESNYSSKYRVVQLLEKTWEEFQQNQKVFDELETDVEGLLQVLNKHRIISNSGELDYLTKMHTYIVFLRELKIQLEKYENNIPLDQSMLLSQKAREKQIPDEIKIIRELNDRVVRFERFNREYTDYKRFRERIKKQGFDAKTVGGVDVRFTGVFIRKLIDESRSLALNKATVEDFDADALEQDLIAYDQWRKQTLELIDTLHQDELAFNREDIQEEFNQIKAQMKHLPVYDKELFLKIQVFEWLQTCLEMLESKKLEQLSLGSWDTKIRQADQYMAVIKDLKSHSIYQRLLWEVEQAKSVIEFHSTQKINQKSLAAKFNTDKQQNYAFFRNKVSKAKIQKMLEIANQCKIDLIEEIRSFEIWINDYEKYTTLSKEDKLVQEYPFEKLRDICKSMYLSPIDYGELYFKLKDKIDTAEMVKLNLRKIIQEYEAQSLLRLKDQQKPNRLRFSRISFDLKLFNKDCKGMKGIKEIENIMARVQKSKDKIKEINENLTQLKNKLNTEEYKYSEITEELNLVKKGFTEVEIDMETEETDIRRQIFEINFTLILNRVNSKKLEYDEYKELEKEFEKLRNHLKDEKVYEKFQEVKAKVLEIVRKIKNVDNKVELEEIQKVSINQCPLIDFSQLINDRDAQLLLGKRGKRSNESKKDKEDSLDLAVNSSKRQKTGSQSSSQKQKVDESSSSSDNESSSDSSSNSGSSSGSGSESDSEGSSSGSGSGSESSSSSSEEEAKINIAKNRSRRTIVPNLNSDFIYEKSVVKKVQEIQKEKQSEQSPSGSESDKEKSQKNQSEEDNSKKEEQRTLDKKIQRKKKEQKRREKEEKRRMEKQLQEYRLQKSKNQQKSTFEQRFNKDASLSIGPAIDKGLQSTLQQMKNKIREQSRLKIRDAIQTTPPVFDSLSKDEKRSLIIDIETQIFNKHPEADHFFRKKIADICENIKFLKDYQEFAEMFAIKKNLQIQKLFVSHLTFKEYIENLEKSVKEKRIQQRIQLNILEQKSKEEEALQQKLFNDQDDLSIPQQQEALGIIYPGSNRSTRHESQQQNVPIVKTQNNYDSDNDSLDSNQAIFSDNEEDEKINKVFKEQQQTPIYDVFQQRQSQQQVNQYQQQYQMGADQGYLQYGVQQQNSFQTIKIQYNPYEIVEQKYNRYNQKKSQEPILYDPLQAKSQSNLPKEKNVAPPGSLLKIWEGSLELQQKDVTVQTQLFSVQDIQVFQQLLPALPHSMPSKGKARLDDVTQHFLRLRKDKRVIKGWITRKGGSQGLISGPKWQENSDKYTKLFEELEHTQKAALYQVFQDVTFYILPINMKTRAFCREMGIDPQSTIVGEHLEESKEMTFDVDNLLQEETHTFAFLSQIKQNFNKYVTSQFHVYLFNYSNLNFLNPEVLKIAPEIVPQNLKIKNEKSFSPISSDDEGNLRKQHKAHILQQQVKIEDMNQRLGQQQYQQQLNVLVKSDEFEGTNNQVMVKTKEEDDDDIDIDGMIEGFKRQNYDIQQIQAQLMAIIHKVKGEKEAKITGFLEELIRNFNNPIQQEIPAMQNQHIGYGQPQYGQGLITQQQMYPNQQIIGQQMQFGAPSQQVRQIQSGFPVQQPFMAGQSQIRPQIHQTIGGAVFPPIQTMGVSYPSQINQSYPQRQGGYQQGQIQPQMFQQNPIGMQGIRPPPGQMLPQQQQMIRPPTMNQAGFIQQQQPQFGNIPNQYGIQGQQYQSNLQQNQQQKR